MRGGRVRRHPPARAETTNPPENLNARWRTGCSAQRASSIALRRECRKMDYNITPP